MGILSSSGWPWSLPRNSTGLVCVTVSVRLVGVAEDPEEKVGCILPTPACKFASRPPRLK